MGNDVPYKCIVCKVPIALYEGIKKLEKEFQNKGLPINRTQISVKLGNDILDGKIIMKIPTFKYSKKNMIDLGGNMFVKQKKR